MKFPWRRNLAVYRRLDSLCLHHCRTFYNINSQPITAALPQQPLASAAAAFSDTNPFELKRSYCSFSNLRTYSRTDLRSHSLFSLNPSTRTGRILAPRFLSWSAAHRNPATTTKMAEPKWTGVKVRNTFFEYFKERGHTIGMHISHHSLGYGLIIYLFVNFDDALFSRSLENTNLHCLTQCPHRRLSLTMTPPCSSPMRA